MTVIEDTELVARLSPELIVTAELMPVREASDLVRTYYAVQENRIALAAQMRAARADGSDVAPAQHVLDAIMVAEARAKALLHRWTRADRLASWSRQVVGVGPVLAAGLRAEIDVTRAKHASSVWRFAGLDPTAEWGKGQKRPWNAFLKVLAWRLGDSFVKQSSNERSLYGSIYREAKDELVERNEAGGFAEAAAARLASGVRVPRPGTSAREALDAGRLPDGQIDLRARRKCVKTFLAHYWIAGRIIEHLPWDHPYIVDRQHHAFIEPEVPWPEA